MATKKVVFEIDIKGAKEVLELQKRIAELKKELKGTKDPTIADQLLTDIAKLDIELGKAKQAAKAAQLEFQAKDETISSYKRLSAQLILAREKYKNLASEAVISGVKNEKAIEGARLEAVRLDMQLKRIDANTGVFGRNVGNYAGSLKGLFASLKGTIQSSGLIGRGGIGALVGMISGGITKLEEGLKKYNETFNSTFLITQKVADATNEVVSEYVKERVSLDTLTGALTDNNLSYEEKQAALDTLKNQYPDYFGNLDLENLKVSDIEKAYAGANAQLLESLKIKTKTAILEKQLIDATEKQLQAEKDAVLVSGTLGEQIAKNGDAANFLANQLTSFFSTSSAETAKAAVNVEQVDKAVNDLVNSIATSIPANTAAFGNLAELTKGAADKSVEVTKKAEEQRRKDYQKTLDDILKAQEQFAKDQAAFEQKQAQSFKDLQKELAQSIVDSIEDEGKRALAQQKLNFDQQSAERKAQFEEIIRQLEDQEALSVKLYGENSKEVIALRNKNAALLLKLQQVYDKLSIEEAKAYQNELTAIDAKGAADRDAQAQADFAAQIEQQQAYQSELERAYELQVSQIEEAVALGNKTIEQGESEKFQILKDSLIAQRDLIQGQIDGNLFANEQERQDLVLAKQKLNEQLAKLGKEQTENEEKEQEERRGKIAEIINQIGNAAQQTIGALGNFLDAINAREQQQLEQQIAARQANIANLEEQLETASGLERAYLEQKIEDEKNAAEQIAKEAERVRKQAAKTQKAVAIVQSIISGFLAVNNTLASLPFPANIGAAIGVGVLAAAQTAAIIAQPLATGGIVGQHINGTPIKRDNGDNVLTTLKTGEVVLNQQQQSRIGSDALSFAGVPGFAMGGMVASIPSLPPSVSKGVQTGADLTALIEETRRLAIATNNRIDNLEVQYTPNTDRAVQNDRRDKVEIKTTATL
jgi:hypothetical protein